jgi:hypothetical protein
MVNKSAGKWAYGFKNKILGDLGPLEKYGNNVTPRRHFLEQNRVV